MAGALQRIGYLTLVPKLLSDLGVDPAEILKISGLRPHGLDNANEAIPYDTVTTLIRACVERTGCGHFGLLLGHRVADALSLETVSDIFGPATTVGLALSNVVARQDRLASGTAVYLLDQGSTILCGFAIYQNSTDVAAQLNDLALAAGMGLLARILTPCEMSSIYVCLPRSAPREVGIYAAHLGNVIQFGSYYAGICLPKSLLDRPIAISHSGLVDDTPIQAKRDFGLALRLRQTLAVTLLNDEYRTNREVSRLGMPVRTFHRRLAKQGIGFQGMLDEVRLEIASELLLHTCLNISVIATILRYADTAVFTTSFRRWTGHSPTGWQEKHGVEVKRTRHQTYHLESDDTG
jgi:AraC-like DNA-binding protein